MTRVQLEVDGGIGRVTLARPEKKNALDRETADELREALRLFERDAGVRVVVLGASGADFCVGADLDALERLLDASPEAQREDAGALAQVYLAMRLLAKPMLAAVRGRALGGGAGLATACDIVMASDDARIGYPELRVGFVPAIVMTMLRRCVGEKIAADLVLTGRILSAAEAERIGLVSRVVPASSLDASVSELAATLAATPAAALAQTKRLFYELDDLSFAAGIAAGVEVNAAARATDAFREGVRAFRARRKL
jgi:methylglutaconyl-CoA hydratase